VATQNREFKSVDGVRIVFLNEFGKTKGKPIDYSTKQACNRTYRLNDAHIPNSSYLFHFSWLSQ